MVKTATSVLVVQLVILGTTLGYLAYCAHEVIIKIKQAKAIAKNVALNCVVTILVQHRQNQSQVQRLY